MSPEKHTAQISHRSCSALPLHAIVLAGREIAYSITKGREEYEIIGTLTAGERYYALRLEEKDDYGTHELLYDIALSACADEDYLDLAEFHRDSGDWEEAMKVAEAGLEKADGNKYTLRSFVIDRLEATGKRARATELRFDQFFSAAFFKEYLKFRRECSDEEWAAYEERVAERMKSAYPDARLFYHMHRGESSDALTILLQHGRKLYWNSDVFAAAEKLEADHPERMYDCYVRSMGNLYETAGRDVYALKAR